MKQSMTPSPGNIRTEYALAHWRDDIRRWQVSAHRFLTTTTQDYIVGQFIVSYWFDCPIYEEKAFLILQTAKGMRTKNIENIINNEDLKNNDSVKVLETFICPAIDNNKVKGEYTSNISLCGLNSESKLFLSLRETDPSKTEYPFYCTLPSFTLKN